MSVKSSVKRADGGGERAAAVGRALSADVRLRVSGGRLAEERRSAEEHRRSVAYGRARGGGCREPVDRV